MTRRLVARLIVMLLAGVVVGYAVGVSLERDAARGRALSLKEYVASFESYRKGLITSEVAMPYAIVGGIVLAVLVFGAYEILALGMDKGLAAIERRRDVGPQPGTPPPW